MHTLVSFLVDNIGVSNSNYAHGVYNTGVSTLIKHMVSTKSLHEIHLVILTLSLMHEHSCTMDDNPLLVEVCLVVMLIS